MPCRQVAADYPGCREVLRRHGEPEDRPAKFGHLEPLDHFARRRGIDPEQLLAELSQAAGIGVDRESARAQLVHRPFIIFVPPHAHSQNHVIGGFVWALVPGEASLLGPLSGIALVLAAVLFLSFLLRQLAGNLHATWGRLILAAGVWMVLWAGLTLALRSHASAAGPGAYDEAMRQLLMELAIFGFALNAIYGFGQRLLSGIVGSGTPRARTIEATFWLHDAGVVLLSLAHVGWMAFAGPLGVAALAAGAFS